MGGKLLIEAAEEIAKLRAERRNKMDFTYCVGKIRGHSEIYYPKDLETCPLCEKIEEIVRLESGEERVRKENILEYLERTHVGKDSAR